MIDKRIQRTQSLIKNAFFDLLKSKSIDEIKVTEIVNNAGIGRGTFYLHYQDVYDLQEQIESVLYKELAVFIEEASELNKTKVDLLTLSRNLIHYVDEHRDVFELITKNRSYKDQGTKFRKIVYDRVIQDYLHSANSIDNSTDYMIEGAFVVFGIVGVIEEWLIGDLSSSKDELITSLHKILTKMD